MVQFKINKWGMYMNDTPLRIRDLVLYKGDIIAISEPRSSRLNPLTTIYECKKVESDNSGNIELVSSFKLSDIMIAKMIYVIDYNEENTINEIRKLF